ncbi:amino acid ABC transporter permease [Streptococcus phocae subsp. salmonis]|uniref:amino acid ABC transporter permease n=1 Tax=Streptococcus phocae TaxID=119224 RepID=UPI0005315EDD|nr:amino acid ABC transporter permease [Streptococcus phocae]KGR72610.1 amino acid ABC transporter permease [Streptococcus phocae subsp. salmonis]KGR73418.1 amino acid ABC transporter permease [Streptococcus phocae subsp. salmonis]
MINLKLIADSLSFVLAGLPYTLGISGLSFVSGLLIGLCLALVSRGKNKLINHLVRAYISVMRGVPMIVVLFVLYFGLPYYGLELPALLCAYIGFSLVSAAYIAEIFRSSIDAIDKGQWEAAKALGVSYSSITTKIILPQAFRIAVPPLGNVVIDMVKSSSLAAMITVPDIFQNAKIIGGREWDYMSMYVLVALIYWTIAFVLERVQGVLEEKLQYQ